MSERRVRKKRDPQGTREAILDAAREVLAEDGKEGLSVARVAQLAGVNRGTAYQHFQTREQLIEATAAWVSDKLYQAVFGEGAAQDDQPVENIKIESVNQRIAEFAMENPALGRIWLFEVLSSSRPASDPFWREYEAKLKTFAATEYAQEDIDVEVLSVIIIASSFIWPVWARAHARSGKERKQMAQRFTRELLRLSLHGTLCREKYADLIAHVRQLAARE